MMQAKWFTLAVGTAAVVMVGMVDSAEAAAIKYNVQGATLSFVENGATQTRNLTGSFFFDGDTSTYSNIAIDSGFSGGYVANSAPGSTADELSLTKTVFGPLTFNLVLGFASSLTGIAGNTVFFNPATSTETLNGSILGNSVSATATINGGSVVAVPTPALLPGLIGMGIVALRKRKAAVLS